MTYNIKIIRHNYYVIRVKVAQLDVLYVTRLSLALRYLAIYYIAINFFQDDNIYQASKHDI